MRTQALLVVALMAGVTAACSDGSPAVPQAAGPFSAHADSGGTQHDEFVLVSGVSSLRVVMADTGKNLFEAASPSGAAVRPVVVTDPSQVRLDLVSTGLNGASEVDVQLSSSVLWQVTVDGGTTDASLDLRGGTVSGVDVVGGTSHLDLTVPAPKGTMTVRESGGVSALSLHAAAAVPAQVRFSGGAGTATIDGAARSGVSGGTTVTPTGWAAATNKYDIELDAGVSSFVLDRP
ncbi:MAG TPA: hypothetical protein VK662_09550 [Acidothermaceae bacterium]|nr:hypothetical protein [Acidothermaceae bacterium]